MKEKFISLSEQEQLSELARHKVSLEFIDARIAVEEYKLSDEQIYIACHIFNHNLQEKEDTDLSANHQKNAITPLLDLLRQKRQASAERIDLMKEARQSEFESVREAAWEDVDRDIENIEFGVFEGEHLQNILQALSIGPIIPESSDEPGDKMRLRLQNGEHHHYNLVDFLSTNSLIQLTGYYGKDGDRRSVLTQKGEDILERLTQKHGVPAWKASLEASDLADNNADNNSGGDLNL